MHSILLTYYLHVIRKSCLVGLPGVSFMNFDVLLSLLILRAWCGIQWLLILTIVGGGRMVRWCWVIFQCQGVILIALAVGADWGCLDIFLSSIISFFFLREILSLSLSLSLSLCRQKYCRKGPLSPKQLTNQPYHSISFCFTNVSLGSEVLHLRSRKIKKK